ncbi:GTP-binding protein [Actinomyces radicidentis]|uniref:CobW C-terminal domain-containing protein n=1 Tax=Actinomyces radicidentis TaxID=111015 RepID=A0A0X8JES5_ACTRD|nr:GTP-binding protein [Actinomyces radicidentis]AMD87504.1 hypothetical protein AXF14_07805 [Actinomyces radicidentis]
MTNLTRPAAHDLVLVSAVQPALLDLVALSLHGTGAVTVSAAVLGETELDADRPQDAAAEEPDDGPTRGVLVRFSVPDDEEPSGAAVLDVRVATRCWTCAVREALLSLALERAALEPDGVTVVLLPPGIELVHLVPGLADAVAHEPSLRLAGVAHAVDVDAAAEDLLTHTPLTEALEDAGAVTFPGDTRCTGEVHMVGLGYADVVLALGDDPVGADLVEHLRPHDTLLVPGLDGDLPGALRSVDHDADAALARVHPATTRAWGGPVEHGVRTLDLNAELPFHPGRLRELVADLAGRGLCARGCFWLPSRPGRVCSWEVAGGVVSVGDAGTWEDLDPWTLRAGLDDGGPSDALPSTPRCHLVVTGVADDAECERVRDAFARIILRPEELEEALAWVGAPDGLEDWFGEG